ncbi:MAG TPA: Na(+)/H(+) antiporter subunit D [Bacteroidota bacterium]|nr:Na(+)/H(+) antiporter subunit D [Bacteroidota bacterium]
MPTDLVLHPALVLLGGAVVLPLLPRSLRSSACVVLPLLSLAVVLTSRDGATLSVPFLDYTLVVLKVDQLSRVFATVFCLVAFAGEIYAFHLRDTPQQVAALAYAGSALGVTFAGDYLTLIIFWELMAVSSTYLVWARGTEESHRAGLRYLFVHLFGGSMLLAGILLTFAETGTLAITTLVPNQSLSSWLILAGVALNAAVPPLNAWLPDAYPRATVTGAVFLSAFTTKSAVYVLVRVFPGWEILLILGVMMTLYGVVFAVLSNDIRGILAYHIISQVGFMVAGVGIGTELSLNGSVAHAFSHILYKALLFMGAGVVLHTTGTTKLTELGGLLRAIPSTFWLYMVGAFSISGVPLFNGFVSKSMVVSAAGEAHHEGAYLLLHLASVGTFLSIALKLPAGTWFGENRNLTPTQPPKNMLVGMGFLSLLCVGYGVMPSLLYRQLPYPVAYEPYTIAHINEAVQMLALTFVAFLFLKSKFVPSATITLDTDWFYRKPARFLNTLLVDGIAAMFDWTERVALRTVHKVAGFSRNPLAILEIVRRNPAPLATSNPGYDPDVARRPLGSLLTLVLLCAVGVFVLSMLWMMG